MLVEINIYNVTFRISDGIKVIKNAKVSFDGLDYLTNANGTAIIKGVETGIYSYAVSAQGYVDVNDIVTMIDTSVIERITMNKLTGIDEAFAREIKCFPNPAYGKVTISISGYSFKDGSITVINNLGQLVKKIPLIQGVHYYTLNKEDVGEEVYSEGIYFILIHADSKLIGTKKLILSKE